MIRNFYTRVGLVALFVLGSEKALKRFVELVDKVAGSDVD